MIAENPSSALASLDAAHRLLAEIQTPRDAKAAVAAFDVLKRVARELGLSLHQQNQIAEGRLRAQRRGGELLQGADLYRGGNPKSHAESLDSLGIDHNDSHRWQMIARLDEAVFEGYIADVLANGDEELTTAGLLRLKLTKPVPGSVEPRELPLLRFSQADLPSATIITLILRVLFPDAVTALDVTYGSGAFWDGSAHVTLTAHDAQFARAPDGIADFRDLSRYQDAAFDVVLFDPPHVADAGVDSIMGQRFGTYGRDDLEEVIVCGTREVWRVAGLGIIVKITDHSHSQMFQWETQWVHRALEGQTPYDIVHQVRSGALIDPKWEEQKSAYNNGSTYLIFRKGDQRHMQR